MYLPSNLVCASLEVAALNSAMAQPLQYQKAQNSSGSLFTTTTPGIYHFKYGTSKTPCMTPFDSCGNRTAWAPCNLSPHISCSAVRAPSRHVQEPSNPPHQDFNFAACLPAQPVFQHLYTANPAHVLCKTFLQVPATPYFLLHSHLPSSAPFQPSSGPLPLHVCQHGQPRHALPPSLPRVLAQHL